MVKSPILIFDGAFGGIYCSRNPDWFICKDPLTQLFEVPDTAQKIQIVAYKKPGVGRTKVQILDVGEYDNNLVIRDTTQFLTTYTMDSVQKLTGGHNVWYIDVYYWD